MGDAEEEQQLKLPWMDAYVNWKCGRAAPQSQRQEIDPHQDSRYWEGDHFRDFKRSGLPSYFRGTSHCCLGLAQFALKHEIVIDKEDKETEPTFSLLTGGKFHVEPQHLREFYRQLAPLEGPQGRVHVPDSGNLPRVYLSENRPRDEKEAFHPFFDLDITNTEQSEQLLLRLARFAQRALCETLRQPLQEGQRDLLRVNLMTPSTQTVKGGRPKMSAHLVFPRLRCNRAQHEWMRLLFEGLALKEDEELRAKAVSGDLIFVPAIGLRPIFSGKAGPCKRCSAREKWTKYHVRRVREQGQSSFFEDSPKKMEENLERLKRSCEDCGRFKPWWFGPGKVLESRHFLFIGWVPWLGGEFEPIGGRHGNLYEHLDKAWQHVECGIRCVPDEGKERDPVELARIKRPSDELREAPVRLVLDDLEADNVERRTGVRPSIRVRGGGSDHDKEEIVRGSANWRAVEAVAGGVLRELGAGVTTMFALMHYWSADGLRRPTAFVLETNRTECENRPGGGSHTSSTNRLVISRGNGVVRFCRCRKLRPGRLGIKCSEHRVQHVNGPLPDSVWDGLVSHFRPAPPQRPLVGQRRAQPESGVTGRAEITRPRMSFGAMFAEARAARNRARKMDA